MWTGWQGMSLPQSEKGNNLVVVCIQSYSGDILLLGLYLKCVILRYPLHHIGHRCLKDLFKSEWIHHCKHSSKVLQDLFLLFHSNSLAVSHSNVCLLVIGNLNLIDIQCLHSIFHKFDVYLRLFWLKLLVRNELSLCGQNTWI